MLDRVECGERRERRFDAARHRRARDRIHQRIRRERAHVERSQRDFAKRALRGGAAPGEPAGAVAFLDAAAQRRQCGRRVAGGIAARREEARAAHRHESVSARAERFEQRDVAAQLVQHFELSRLGEQAALEGVAQQRDRRGRGGDPRDLDAAILERAVRVLEAPRVLATRREPAGIVLEVVGPRAEADRGMTAAGVALVRADVEIVEGIGRPGAVAARARRHQHDAAEQRDREPARHRAVAKPRAIALCFSSSPPAHAASYAVRCASLTSVRPRPRPIASQVDGSDSQSLTPRLRARSPRPEKKLSSRLPPAST